MNTTPIFAQLLTGLMWLAKALIAITVIAILLLPLLIMTIPNMEEVQQLLPKGIGTAWLIVVGVAASLFVVYIAWNVLRALLLYPLGSWQVFGATTRDRLIGLGITAIIVPRPVAALVMVPPTFLLQLLDRLPHQAVRIPMSGAFSNDSTDNIKEPVIQLSMMILDIVSEVAKALTSSIERILTPEVVIALAIWAVMGNLLSAVATAQDETQSDLSMSRLHRYVQTMSSAQRHGIVLATAFLLGTYLSIAAIVAIPWLHEEKVSPGLSRDSLEKMLNGILPSASTQLDDLLHRVSPTQEDPLAPLTKYVSERPVSADTYYPLSWMLNDAIADSKNVRSKAIEQLKQMPTEIMQRAAKMRQEAMSAFDLATATPMSSLERSYFIREIQSSVSSDYAELERTLKTCASAFIETDKEFRAIAQVSQTFLTAGVSANTADGADLRNNEIMQAGMLSKQLMSASQSLRDACEAPVTQRSVYTPPEPGSAWGPFGLVARWLLRTKSFELALITGMLGFGLLGSVIATFIRVGKGRDQKSLIAEVTSVLVRGISAAIVVFLAVKGGLVVFSTGESEPNAYVVFFTCLVGAVYSEDVWKLARSKFFKKDAREDKSIENEQTMAEDIQQLLDKDTSTQKNKASN